MAGEAITWLHLSDLHRGQPGEGGRWPQRCDEALEDMREQARKHGPPDLILFTGDLTFAGKPDEFVLVDETLDAIKQAVGGDPIVVPVPGNHDLVRPRATNAAAQSIKKYLENSELRRSITTGSDPDNVGFLRGLFANYHAWWQRSIEPDWKSRELFYHEGLFRGDFRLTVESKGLRLGLMGLNSAFLQMFGGDYYGKLAVEPEQAGREFVTWAGRNHAAVILMHHPLEWLALSWQDRFRSDIYQSRRFVACLFGHMHRPVSTDENRNGQVRRWLQAASLFGLEHYGEEPSRERRVCGYSWGRIERRSGTSGRLTVWRRQAHETGGGDIRFDRPAGESESKSFKIALRDLDTGTPRPGPARIELAPWKDHALAAFAEEHHAARDMYRAGRHAEALHAYQVIRDKVEAKGGMASDNDLAALLASTRVYISACLLSLQDLDGAAEQARDIEDSRLAPAERLVLAQVLAQVGDLERARSILEGTEEAEARPARQLLAIERVLARRNEIASQASRTPGRSGRKERRSVPTLDPLLDGLDAEEADWIRSLVAADLDSLFDTIDPTVGMRGCALLIQLGKQDRATRWALDALAKEGIGPGLRAQAVATLLSAIQWFANEVPFGCEPIARDRMHKAIPLLQHYLDPFADSPLAGIMPDGLLAEEMAQFQMLSRDELRTRRACERMRASGLDPSVFESMEPEGIENPKYLRDPGHPWHARYREAARLQLEGKVEQSRQLVDALCREFPGRMLLEYLAAVLSRDAGELERALEHAERAFDALPGHGQALLLAVILYRCGHYERIWSELRSSLEGSPYIDGRRILADVAVRVEPARGPEYWQQVLDHPEATPSDRMFLAHSLDVDGRQQEASDTAWLAFEQDGMASLTTNELVRCTQLQLARQPEPGRERWIALARAFWTRVERDDSAANAASWYMTLRERAGEPAELPGHEMSQLEQLGLVRSVHPGQVAASLQAISIRQHAIFAAYYQGASTVETVARELGRPEAEVLESLRSRQWPLMTPIGTEVRGDDIAGKHVLVGVWELLLLDALGVLGRFDEALGEDGQVVLFREIDEQIRAAPSWFGLRERPHELAQLMDLRNRIERDSSMQCDTRREGEPAEEAAWCKHRGAVLIQAYSETGFSLWELAMGLRQRGHLRTSDLDRLPRGQANREGDIDWPETIALDHATLLQAQQAGILDAIVEAFPGKTLVTPHARAELDQQIQLHDNTRNARQRASRIHAWRNDMQRRRRVRVIERPQVELPRARHPDDKTAAESVRDAVTWLLALDKPADQDGAVDLWLLRADHVSAELFEQSSPVSLLGRLAWTPDDFQQLGARTRMGCERVLSFSRVVRKLDSEPRMANRLVELGFGDAYTPEDLLRLAAEYGGLSGPRAGSVLDAIEARARRALPFEAEVFSRLALATLYGSTVWAAWCQSDRVRDDALRGDLTRVLLQRASEMRYPGDDVLSLLVETLVELAVREPITAFAPDSESLQWRLSPDSLAGRMWQSVADWLVQAPRHRHAIENALTNGMLHDDGVLASDEHGVRAGPLYVAVMACRVEDPSIPIQPGSSIESMAVLSARWQRRPLSMITIQWKAADARMLGLGVEELLERAAQAAGAPGTQVLDDGLTWTVPVEMEGTKHSVRLPPDAIFLRMSPAARSKLARELIEQRGRDDGRLVACLEALAANGEDPEALRSYAHLAAAAPWKQFRVAPRSLLGWARPYTDRLPSTITDLRALLSEPDRLPENTELPSILIERVTEGSWRDRLDRRDLVVMSSEVIGHPSLPSMWFLPFEEEDSLAETFAKQLHLAMERLEDSIQHSAARVAADVFLCCVATMVGPRPGDGVMRDRAASCVANVLQVAAKPPPSDSLAAVEHQLLSLAAFTVSRLGGEREPLRDRLWLTWRLYQWMIRQSERMPAASRASRLHELIEAEPPFVLPDLADMLDPSRYGPGKFDQRLVAILGAMTRAYTVDLPAIRTPGLEATLEELARRPRTEDENKAMALEPPYSCLGWADVPRTVPDLAGAVLAALRRDADEGTSQGTTESPSGGDPPSAD